MVGLNMMGAIAEITSSSTHALSSARARTPHSSSHGSRPSRSNSISKHSANSDNGGVLQTALENMLAMSSHSAHQTSVEVNVTAPTYTPISVASGGTAPSAAPAAENKAERDMDVHADWVALQIMQSYDPAVRLAFSYKLDKVSAPTRPLVLMF
jgi:hypothetical protein